MSVAVVEYTAENAHRMAADYAARRARLYGTAPVSVVTIAAKPIPSPQPVEEAEPEHDLLALYRLAYDNSVDPTWGPQIAKRLVKETAEECGVSPSDIYGSSRVPSVAHARQLAAWRIAKSTTMSMPRIAKLMGGRDHTTILHSIRRINEMLGENVRGVGNVVRGRKR